MTDAEKQAEALEKQPRLVPEQAQSRQLDEQDASARPTEAQFNQLIENVQEARELWDAAGRPLKLAVAPATKSNQAEAMPTITDQVTYPQRPSYTYQVQALDFLPPAKRDALQQQLQQAQWTQGLFTHQTGELQAQRAAQVQHQLLGLQQRAQTPSTLPDHFNEHYQQAVQARETSVQQLWQGHEPAIDPLNMHYALASQVAQEGGMAALSQTHTMTQQATRLWRDFGRPIFLHPQSQQNPRIVPQMCGTDFVPGMTKEHTTLAMQTLSQLDFDLTMHDQALEVSKLWQRHAQRQQTDPHVSMLQQDRRYLRAQDQVAHGALSHLDQPELQQLLDQVDHEATAYRDGFNAGLLQQGQQKHVPIRIDPRKAKALQGNDLSDPMMHTGYEQSLQSSYYQKLFQKAAATQQAVPALTLTGARSQVFQRDLHQIAVQQRCEAATQSIMASLNAPSKTATKSMSKSSHQTDHGLER